MGTSSCGEFCGHPTIDKQEIMQIEITPRYDAVDWIKSQQTPAFFPLPQSQPQIAKQLDRIVEHYNIENEQTTEKNHPLQLIMWEDERPSSLEEVSDVPMVETKIEQNHLIVPTAVVKQRVSNELRMMVGKQFTRSPLEDGSKWYLLPSGNYFNGVLKDAAPSGIGTYLLPNKLFFGEVVNRKPEGKGVILSQGLTYQGEFKQGHASGQSTLNYGSTKVQGVFQNGNISKGKLLDPQFEYEGEFLDGLPSGSGTYQHLLSNISYTGQFWKGKFHGIGTYACPQYVYKGEFLNGLKHGHGSIEYALGETKNKSGFWDMDYLVKEA